MDAAAKTAVRIAAAQLAGLSRTRTLVPAGPFTGLIAPDGPDYLNYTVAARPGEPVEDPDEVDRGLDALRSAFPEGTLRFELIEEAAPGAVRALTSLGFTVTLRIPVLTLHAGDLVVPEAAPGVTVEVVTTDEDLRTAHRIAAGAFGIGDDSTPTTPLRTDPRDGGTVLAREDGYPVAVASWTPVADGVTEVAGVATEEEYRKQGFGALVTAHATRAAVESAGVTLAWLTPGSADADRVYRTVGFQPTGLAVHLAEEPSR
ncbi:GNAT family N-acetyltransferase [Actinokineospora bangkokensis]|uniref:N-acetyltransferase domain-containing protein n=1 Tax=Actinokineospora bangkokensis TaxID=1193682 RepID=A0A1Q9LDW1_9PSEU|nr:GNAT family N-acetyltransferase [Actinokineospora bangkokensis]OLR90220.1 hypothetical protein BJP25_04495 [Actinokineospora bangkokensis]